MDTELSMEFELEIKGARAEREQDLKQLLEEEDGGQPLTYLNENLPRDPGHIPEIDGWCKRRRRGPRRRRDQGWFLGGHFGGGEGRRTTIHWTTEEVDDLIAGVETFGRSGWTKIKENYFSDSDRTRGDLKDKWKILRRVCTGNAQRRRDQPPDDDQIERIQAILND